MIKLEDYLEYLPASNEPLSADVYLIHGSEKTYIVDCGASDEACSLINGIENKALIITHFHADHLGNLSRIEIDDKNLYVGNYTKKYAKRGSEILDSLEINDGIKIRISAIPSSHAKGSLAVTINDKWLLLGDSFYCSTKGYNVSLLHDEIEFIKKEPFEKALCSHDNTVYTKGKILETLEFFYSKKEKGAAHIYVN